MLVKKSKIIYLHPHFTRYGGAGNFVLETGKRLAKKGYEIVVISIRADKGVVKDYIEWIRFVEIGGPLSSSIWFYLLFPMSFFKVRAVLKREGDFVLFPQIFPANWWGFIYKLLYPNTLLVWKCHEPSAFIHIKEWIEAIPQLYMRFLAKVFNPILKRIDVFLARKSDFVFTNSSFTKKRAIEIYGFAEDKVLPVGAGVDVKKLGTHKKRKDQVLAVGNLSKFKNVDVIIKAMKILRGMGVKAELVVVGEGEERRNLQKMADFPGVKFLGRVSNKKLIGLYGESKVFVLASEREPFGRVILEAMSYGVPVIAAKSGGPTEIIGHGVNGFLIPAKDPEILAKKIIKIFSDRRLFEKMSKAAILRAKEFSWDKVIEKMEGHFRNEGVEKREREHFDDIAASYERIYRYRDPFVKYKIGKKINEFVKAVSGAEGKKLSILDLGCGTGEYTRRIARIFPNARIIGLDLSGGILEAAKKKCASFKNVKFVKASAYETGFPDNHFDAIGCFYTLHHLDFIKASREIKRILKEGGIVFFSEPNILNPAVYIIKSIPFIKRRVGDSEDERGVNPLTLRGFFPGFELVYLKTTEFVLPLKLPLNFLKGFDRITSILQFVPVVNLFGGTVIAVFRKKTE